MILRIFNECRIFQWTIWSPCKGWIGSWNIQSGTTWGKSTYISHAAHCHRECRGRKDQPCTFSQWGGVWRRKKRNSWNWHFHGREDRIRRVVACRRPEQVPGGWNFSRSSLSRNSTFPKGGPSLSYSRETADSFSPRTVLFAKRATSFLRKATS